MIDDRKARMRNHFRAALSAMDAQTKKDASGRLVQSLMADQAIDWSITMCYMAIATEPDIGELLDRLRSCGHTVCVPRIRRDL